MCLYMVIGGFDQGELREREREKERYIYQYIKS